MLEIDEITKKYGETIAVHALSCAVRPGEIFGLLGPNGAGKTTTLKVAVGLIRADSGQVRFNGAEVRPGSPVLHQIGYFADEPFLYDKLTGREVLQIAGVLLNMERTMLNRRIASLAAQLEVENLLDRPTETYSRGNRRKIGLIIALLPDPPVLVLDEPGESLDPIALSTVRRILEEGRLAGKAILLSTHQLSMAEGLCDRVGLIHTGRLLWQGSLPEARLHYGLPAGSLEDVFLRAVRKESGSHELMSAG